MFENAAENHKLQASLEVAAGPTRCADDRSPDAGKLGWQSAQGWRSDMNVVANYRFGRICLHVAALVVDRQFKWHLAGIRRELQ